MCTFIISGIVSLARCAFSICLPHLPTTGGMTLFLVLFSFDLLFFVSFVFSLP